MSRFDPSAGPDEEFRRLFERYFRPLFYFFRNRGIPPEDCRDLTQETFMRVYKSMGRFRGEASVQTWLFQIATNLWRNQVRYDRAGKREAKEVSVESAMEKGQPIPADLSLARGAHTRGPLAGLLADEKVELLRRALADLPPQMRRCVLLRIDQNLKYREIAGVMQISIDTVKSQLSQARQRLGEELGFYFDGSGPADVGGLSGR